MWYLAACIIITTKKRKFKRGQFLKQGRSRKLIDCGGSLTMLEVEEYLELALFVLSLADWIPRRAMV